MFVRLDMSTGSATLEDASNFKAFHVEVHNAPNEDTDAVHGALSGWSVRSGEGHVWLYQDAIRRAAGDVDDEWAEQFSGMVDYARGAGWVDEGTSAIRAHIEYV